MIDLSSNEITIIEKGDFRESTSLKILKLQNNLIRDIMDHAFKDLISLFFLDLSNNSITFVSLHHFISLKNLRYLFLNYNRINVIHAKAFSNLIALHTLDLSFNNMRYFAEGQFFGMESLQNLYLQNNRIFSVNGMFWGLFNLKFLEVDEFSICCAKPRSRNHLQCVSPVNEIASCENLISAPVLNVAIWYIAFLATVGNIIALICSTSTFKRSSFAYFIFSRNLSVADFLMGIYLYIIAITNLVYTGRYGFEDYSWRHSFLCTFAGILATVSSEASALFVLMITIDRVVAIKNPFSRRNKVWVIGSSALAWVIAFSLAVFPVLPLKLSMFEDFYAQSPVCISLPLSVHRQLGWQYSMVIFIGLNFLIFLGIIFGQFLILYEVIKSGSNSQASNIRRREITLAKTVVSVVVTDILCWIPIGITGMLTFYGIDVTMEIYAWIIVLVLPVNSAINPILYTLTAIIRDRGRRKVSESNIQKEKELLAQENSRLKQKLKIQRDSTNSYM
ncbi:G-protein coupled receptor GRL101-like [Saccostrea cucullata]|uniref:G-protein coupled receptor GRL101-like n=1 Tax=Saccostrea cuccullata TaxID=36930 RepID=UPI002ED225DF